MILNNISPAIVTIPIPDMKTLGQSYPPYRHTYNFSGKYIDTDHLAIAQYPTKGGLIKGPVEGFLRPADALALYEMANNCNGDVLEMGSAWGLSTSILCQAICNAGQNNKVYAIEIDNEFQKITANTIKSLGLKKFYESIPGDAQIEGNLLIEKKHKFNFAFIDHDHSYHATLIACHQLNDLLEPGSFALIHDFNDARNTSEPEYGIYHALTAFLKEKSFSFFGVIGCCALIRKHI